MTKQSSEWFKQADYNMDTAEFMHSGGRHFYSAFMCHLAVEKAMKAFYQEKLSQPPPKTHNLIYLLNKIAMRPDEHMGKMIAKLNEANIATRYPDDIDQLQKNYTEAATRQILDQTQGILEWIKKQL